MRPVALPISQSILLDRCTACNFVCVGADVWKMGSYRARRKGE
jgi:hypothetical protein